MVDFKYDFAFLIKMIKYVFLPVLAIVILTAFIIYIYSRKVKKQDITRYNYLVEFWTTFLAILIIGSLFAVTVGFSISLSNAIRMYNLIEGHEVIYYLVLVSPLIPLLFLAIYIYRMIIVLLNKPKKQKRLVKEEDIVPEPNAIVEQEKIEEESISEEEKESLPDIEEELAGPIVISEREDNEKEETTNQEVIEVRDFIPIVVPERCDSIKEVSLEKEFDSSVDKSEEALTITEDETEEIELL